MFLGIAGQRPGLAEVTAFGVCLGQLVRQHLHPVQAEVVAVRGDRVHAHRRIAHQDEAIGMEAFGIDRHQRVAVAFAGQFQGAQAVAEGRVDPQRELGRRQGHQFGGSVAGDRPDGRGLVSGHGQHGQGVAVQKALMGRAVVGALVAHAADDGSATEVQHARADAGHAAQAGEAAVGGHHQGRPQHASVGQRDLGSLGVALQGGDPGVAGERDLVGPRRSTGVAGLADAVVGHQPAQLFVAIGLPAEGQHPGRIAVGDLGGLQRCDLVRGQSVPQAQAGEDALGAVGEGDVTPVLGRCHQGIQRGLFQHLAAQAGIGQGAGQGQTGRAGAHDQHVGRGLKRGGRGGVRRGGGVGHQAFPRGGPADQAGGIIAKPA